MLIGINWDSKVFHRESNDGDTVVCVVSVSIFDWPFAGIHMVFDITKCFNIISQNLM